MYVEVREVVDYLAKPLFHHVPRAKISWLSEELANTLIITIINDKAGIPSSELPSERAAGGKVRATTKWIATCRRQRRLLCCA